ncbi:hypothetical protein ACO229_06535 [Promicromonospora sp. MS192]|uniref:hypothetical protein n=1 Tax=Promicromonospora sp. MS192 TaxID=3412684 RepID=UPI003C2C030C
MSQPNTGSVIRQAGPLYLSLHHVGDETDDTGEALHRYEYVVINQDSTGQRYRAKDLHNKGVVDTDAAMCSLIGHLWAIGRTFQDFEHDPDESMDYLPLWLQQTTARHLTELMDGMELHEERLTGPTDMTFDFDDPES